ncbi:MAG TPA: YdcF family protein [Usitatibacter sp.]|nr:YdcF family protein [Usitatibacter sp.]
MAHYLVILGAAVRQDGTPSGSLSRRVEGALAFARSVGCAKFLATGGVGRHGPAEALVIRELLRAGGIRDEDILVEDRATDTLESIVNCDAILRLREDVDVVVPCTSRYHVARCALLLALLGYRVRWPSMPADRRHIGTWKWLLYWLKELVATPYDALLLLLRLRGLRQPT